MSFVHSINAVLLQHVAIKCSIVFRVEGLF